MYYTFVRLAAGSECMGASVIYTSLSIPNVVLHYLNSLVNAWNDMLFECTALCRLQLSRGSSCQANVTCFACARTTYASCNPLVLSSTASRSPRYLFTTEVNINDLYLLSCFIGLIMRYGVYIDYLSTWMLTGNATRWTLCRYVNWMERTFQM
jgi:hypothetical protein